MRVPNSRAMPKLRVTEPILLSGQLINNACLRRYNAHYVNHKMQDRKSVDSTTASQLFDFPAFKS